MFVTKFLRSGSTKLQSYVYHFRGKLKLLHDNFKRNFIIFTVSGDTLSEVTTVSCGVHTLKYTNLFIYFLVFSLLMIESCENSIYGCCWDKKTLKDDTQGTNCPGIYYMKILYLIGQKNRLKRKSKKNINWYKSSHFSQDLVTFDRLISSSKLLVCQFIFKIRENG